MSLGEIVEKLKFASNVEFFRGLPFTDPAILFSSSSVKHLMEWICFAAQAKFCRELEEIEKGCVFKVDRWTKGGDCGGGVTCVLEGKNVIEKGGVNISVIRGNLSPENILHMKSQNRNLDDFSDRFSAIGISCVIHPFNPHSPTMHFNYRYFEIESKWEGKDPIWWFGGGIDITPNYVHKQDIVHFHQSLKDLCDLHDCSFYPKFKKWADTYFYISHRGECRGLGGIFFDDLNYKDPVRLLDFVCDCALKVGGCYVPILNRTFNLPFGEREIEWKLVRRGRYAEFNLVYDRGTKFGLHVPGSRIESILMSLPPLATWKYCHQPESGSKEDELLQYTKHPIDWV